MRYLYGYGEGLLCFVPIFAIVAFIAAALIWNSLPDRTIKRKRKDEEPSE